MNTETAICKECKRSFRPKVEWQVYCIKACQEKASHRRNKDHHNEWRRMRRAKKKQEVEEWS